jgi:predicted O-methyltransferase YrrM
MTPLSKETVLASAEELLPQFQSAIAGIPPEAGFGGVWESEMFLFYAVVRPLAPKQILESGRARGKSTLMLAKCFPDARIVSIELDRDTENARAAEAKLKPHANVDLLYGDSRALMLQCLQHNDAVLIDGPKDFRALKLALDLLATKKPSVVFVHDFPRGSAVRRFAQKSWPGVFFGDDPAFNKYRAIDAARDPRPADARKGYGVFAIFPPGLPAPKWRLRLKMFFAEIFSGLGGTRAVVSLS